jgi:serine/threonine protein kinase
LRGKEYTQASDIYGFGIIAYEICTGLPPYHDVAHEEFLAMKICQGLRPKSNYKIPQLILDVIERCWDADPSNRPKAVDLFKLLDDLNSLFVRRDDINSVIYEQIKEADEINKSKKQMKLTKSHLQ